MTLDNNIGFDLLRAFTVVAAGALTVYTAIMVAHWRSLPYDFSRKLRYLALLGYAVLTAIESWHQLGEPFVLWRCPMLLIVTLAGLFGMMLPEYEDWHDRSRWWDELQGPFDTVRKKSG